MESTPPHPQLVEAIWDALVTFLFEVTKYIGGTAEGENALF